MASGWQWLLRKWQLLHSYQPWMLFGPFPYMAWNTWGVEPVTSLPKHGLMACHHYPHPFIYIADDSSWSVIVGDWSSAAGCRVLSWQWRASRLMMDLQRRSFFAYLIFLIK